MSAGPLPKTDQLVFKALQTYSHGDVVRWIEVPKAGDSPDHPAPVLKLAAAVAAAPSVSVAVARTDDASADGTSSAVGFGRAGLAAGLAGLVMGLLAYRRIPVTES